MLQLIPASTYREQPWKNGGGLAYEIAADEAWRVAIATIDRDGPFSDYRGFDRTIVAIEGDPVELEVGDERIRLAPFEPFEFAGEDSVFARVQGRARDLNVMTDREAFAHDVEIVQGRHRFVLDDDELALVYALDATVWIDGVECAVGDAAAIEEAEGFDVETAGHAAVIRITPL